jgi:transcriptional regulator with XRE-family HTH domain
VAETSRIRKQLGAELRAVRQLAGLTQRDLRDQIPTSQAAVSRYERGEEGLPPTRQVVTRWLEICEVTDEATRDRVLALAEAAHNESRTWLDMLGDGTHLQGFAQDREAGARLVRVCQTAMIPGLLQTAEYARQLMPHVDPFNKFDHAAAVRARMDRQEILYQEGRKFEFLIAEHVLAWEPGPGVMPAQLDRLMSLATLATVDIAILPTRRLGALEWHSYDLLELADGSASYVTTELVHGGHLISDAELVAPYVALWERLWQAAARGDDAVELIRKLI